MLEGGYCLPALARSSEAVVRTLMTAPDDENAFNKVLQESMLDESFYEEEKDKEQE